MNSIKMTLGRERREDLNHGDWDDPVTERAPHHSPHVAPWLLPRPWTQTLHNRTRSPRAPLILGMLWTVKTMAWVTSLPRPATCHRTAIKPTKMMPIR